MTCAETNRTEAGEKSPAKFFLLWAKKVLDIPDKEEYTLYCKDEVRKAPEREESKNVDGRMERVEPRDQHL
jgi:hypothetical protein